MTESKRRNPFASIASVLLVLGGCASDLTVVDPRTGIEHTIPERFEDVPGIMELARHCATKGGRK